MWGLILIIGRLELVNIREVWETEDRHFTPWLEKNLDVLSEKLGIELSPQEREKRLGSFTADLLAEDVNSDPVIIECQFGKSDHDHLGKVLTYLTQMNAKKAIWICEDPCQEHINAISWLNEVTPSDFYLVKIDAVRIGESEPAPSFVVLSQPSIEVKTTGTIKKDWAERHKKRFEFWKGLLDMSKSQAVSLFENIKPGREHWISTGAGKSGISYNYLILKNSSRIELYIDTGDGDENKKIFDQLHEQKQAIEADFGDGIDWQRLNEKRASRLSVTISRRIGLRNEDKYKELQNNMINTMVKFENALKERIRTL